jgi:hypothetical protein
MFQTPALSIANRTRSALQLEHALPFVTKAYELYLMNVANLAGSGSQGMLNSIDTATLTTTGDTSSCSSMLAAPDNCAGQRRRFAANSFAGPARPLTALPFCKAWMPC